MYPLYATVRLPQPVDQALRLVPATVGTHRPDGPDATAVVIGGPTRTGWPVPARPGHPVRVLSPDAVREALLRRIRELIEDNGGGELS